MRYIKAISSSTFGAALLVTAGCASIIDGGPRTLSVSTQPAGAKATVSKDSGEAVSVNTTPFTVSLDAHAGYFKGQAYNIRLELPGYRTTEVSVRPTVSGWYIANLLFGGVIGMLIVDPATGAMWRLSPDSINQPLSQTQASLIKSGNGFLVVLASQITAEERAAMVRVQ